MRSKADKQEELKEKLMDADLAEEKKESKEHPELGKKIIKKIVEDHEKVKKGNYG